MFLCFITKMWSWSLSSVMEQSIFVLFKNRIIGLYHPLDGITNPNYNLMCFLTTKKLLRNEEGTTRIGAAIQPSVYGWFSSIEARGLYYKTFYGRFTEFRNKLLFWLYGTPGDFILPGSNAPWMMSFFWLH
jgi:hypothetical protein